MIALFERLVWVVALIALTAFGVWYLVGGAPTTTPSIAVKGESTNKKDFIARIRKEARAEVQNPKPMEAPVVEGEEDKKKRRPARKPTQEWHFVNRALSDRINNYNRAFYEGSKISSEIVDLPDGQQGLKIFEFDENSILGKVGFKEDDVILGLDGEALDFAELSKKSSLRPRGAVDTMYQDYRAKIDSGDPIRVDIVRNGKPVQLFFALGD